MFVVEYRAEKRLVSNIVHRLMGCTYEQVSEAIRLRHSQLTSTRFTGGFPSVCSSPEKGVLSTSLTLKTISEWMEHGTIMDSTVACLDQSTQTGECPA